MEILNKSQRKKVINEALKDFFKKEKMSKYDIWGGGYNIKKDIENGNFYIGLFTFKTSLQEVSYVDFIHIKKIEDIISEIEFPDFSWEDHRKKNNPLFTINLFYYYNNDINKQLHRSRLDWTEEDCLRLARNIIEYYENRVSPSFGYFCYLPNILKEMDKLESEGKSWSEILAGGGDHLFRGLIISKLCNDPNYERKKELLNSKFVQKGYEKWLPHYEKLKICLETVDPIYNI